RKSPTSLANASGDKKRALTRRSTIDIERSVKEEGPVEMRNKPGNISWEFCIRLMLFTTMRLRPSCCSNLCLFQNFLRNRTSNPSSLFFNETATTEKRLLNRYSTSHTR